MSHLLIQSVNCSVYLNKGNKGITHTFSIWSFSLSLYLLAVGEAAAGKASRSLAQHIPGQAGVEGMKVAASGAVGELARARIALDERGQRLGELEERTALMMTSAETFSKHAHEVIKKKKDNIYKQNVKSQLEFDSKIKDSGHHNYER